MMQSKIYNKICVFCASSANVSQAYIDDAYTLGELIAQRDGEVVCGAGSTGLMGAVTQGALSQLGSVIGVIPQFMVDNGWHNADITQLIVTPDMHTRKKRMTDIADAVIAMPGGCGTFEELMEVITWKQLGIYNKPIIILNTCGYYDPMIAMFDKAIEQHFMKQSHRTLWNVASTPQEALSILDSYIDTPQIESKY